MERNGVGRAVSLAGWALLAFGSARGQAPAVPPPPPAPSQAAPAPPSAAASALPASTAAGQASAPTANAVATLPAWDVSTIKPSAKDVRNSMLMFTPDGVRITNVPLFFVVRESFGLEDDRIFGGPAWAKSTNFDIEAKVAPEDAPKLKSLNFDQRRQMLVTLLQDRCGLKFHHETRDMPVYDLVIAKGGSKLTASKPDPPADEGGEKRPNRMLMMNGRGHVESTGADIHGLSRILSSQLHRTVIDKTGLSGNYDYKLDWTPDDAVPAVAKGADAATDNASTQDNAGPSLFTALEEQLGLKLEASKGPVDVVVIDGLEQPTAN
jgi:uncharacterized protein (TIGR03435 family)